MPPIYIFLKFCAGENAVVYNRAVGRSENPGVPVSFCGYNLPPLVEICQKMGVPWHPRHPQGQQACSRWWLSSSPSHYFSKWLQCTFFTAVLRSLSHEPLRFPTGLFNGLIEKKVNVFNRVSNGSIHTKNEPPFKSNIFWGKDEMVV